MQPITKQQLKKMNEEQHEDFVLINVLPRDAFNEKHIRTSINIPLKLEDFDQTVEDVAGSRERKIVVYCANYDCPASKSAGEILHDAGFTQVYDYEGGTQDWFEKKEASKAA